MDAAALALLNKLNSRLLTPDWLARLDALNTGADGAYNPSSTTTLTSGFYRYSSVNIPAGVTITPTGSYLVILVNGNCNIDGLLSASGKGSAGGSSAGNTGTPGAGWVCAGGGGAGGGAATTGYAGGVTNNGVGAGGAVGATGGTAPAVPIINVETNDYFLYKNFITSVAGGGGGGNASGSGGGAGGAGAGVIMLIVKGSLTGTGSIRADGINGSNAGTVNLGGGGGGGGGGVVVVANSFSSITVSANGGTGGAGNGAGTASGGAGGLGTVLKITR